MREPTSSKRPLPRLGFCLLIAFVSLAGGAKPILYDTMDPDCFWHLRVGEQLMREGAHPISDGLSFASIPEPWTPYSWLAEIGMARLWRVGGYRAAVGATSSMVFIFLLAITLATRESVGAMGAGDRRYLSSALATAFAAFLSLPYISFRPVTFAFGPLAICAWLLLRDRRLAERSRAVWGVVPITAFVVNLHLFAALVPLWCGALLIGATIEWVREKRARSVTPPARGIKRYAALTLSTSLACLATPMLPGMLATIRHYGLHDPMVASKVIAEMQPFWHGGMGKVSLTLVTLFGTCLFRARRRLRVGETLWVLVGGILLARMGRMAPAFAIIAAPLFAVASPELSDRALARRGLVRILAVLLALATARVSVAFAMDALPLEQWLNRNGPDAPGFPVKAADYVEAHVPRVRGRIINEFTWGGYLAWRLGPRFQVLLDGRTQVYSPAFWREAYLGDDATTLRFLSGIRADAAVLPVTGSRYRDALVSLGWTIAYGDDRAIVLVPKAE